MRSVLAAITDAAFVAVLGFVGFRFALWATPCGNNLADCFPLAPLIVVCVVLGIAGYFGASYLAWRVTPGQKVFGANPNSQR
jgi:hypothetical protein